MKTFNENDIFRNQVTFCPKYKWVSNGFDSQDYYFFDAHERYLNLDSKYVDLYELATNSLTSTYQYIVNKKQYKTYAGVDLSEVAYGQEITGSLLFTSSISREYILESGSRRHINALKNTINYYSRLSTTFNFSNFSTQSLVVYYIPSIFYGNSIQRKTLEIQYTQITGSRNLVTLKCADLYGNGELINITSSFYGTSSTYVGNILYNEGIVILNDSNFFSQSANSVSLEYNGTVKQNQLIIFASADKNEFNNSNNPTYKDTLYKSPLSSSNKYIEDPKQLIYNINSSSYSNYDEEYKKITYISSIGIFDKDKNLIGIAKLSKPIKKTQNDSFTFKLRYDML